MGIKLWHLPLRLPTGLYLLDAGLSKQRADDRTAEQLHSLASTAFPQFAKMSPQQFVALLSASEVALAAALLAVPLVSPLLAGLGLLGYGAALNQLYLRVPGMHEEGSLRPTQQGVPLSKDFWLTGIGMALVLDALASPRRRR
jgi:hypothetical protein